MTPKNAYRQQRYNARHRGVGFDLTFDEWTEIWLASGHLEERGRGNGYMMCRKGDAGPYAVGNVFIAPGWFNSSQRARKKSGLPLGVSYQFGKKTFRAARSVDGKWTYLGSFRTPEQAHAAYIAANPSAASADFA
jgi:hypothetical protein